MVLAASGVNQGGWLKMAGIAVFVVSIILTSWANGR
jgi:hypothetical protein